MWVYRLGAERAKRMLLTGDLITGNAFYHICPLSADIIYLILSISTGKEAERIGLITAAVPSDKLDEEVDKFVKRMSSVPKNQLMMQKLVVNSGISLLPSSFYSYLLSFFCCHVSI